jgi:hypothetical protein
MVVGGLSTSTNKMAKTRVMVSSCGSPSHGSSFRAQSRSTRNRRLAHLKASAKRSGEGEDKQLVQDHNRREALFSLSGALLAAGSSDLVLDCRRASASGGKQSLYDFTAKMYGEDVPLSRFDGKVTVVLNVASE